MKHFKCNYNTIWEFEDNCFDKEGNCINKIAIEKIEENSLIAITEEEYLEIQSTKQKEAEAEATSQEELTKAEKLVALYEQLSELGVI